MNLDALDISLISELSRDARASFVTLSEKLGVSHVTVRRRMQRLLDNGSMALEVVPDWHQLGYQTTAFLGLHVELSCIQEVGEELKKRAAVVYAAITVGRFDILMWAIFRSSAELADFLERDLGAIKGIRNVEKMVNLRICKDPWRVQGQANVNNGIDELDRRIICALHTDVRKPYADVARTVRISIPTVRHRLERLVSEGVVGLSAVVNPLLLGYALVANIGVQARIGALSEVQDKLVSLENVRYVALVGGRYDIMLTAGFGSTGELARFMYKELGSMDSIQRTESLINLELIKLSFKEAVNSL